MKGDVSFLLEKSGLGVCYKDLTPDSIIAILALVEEMYLFSEEDEYLPGFTGPEFLYESK